MHLTTREFFIDGIKRDRWVWSGDAIQSYLMNYYLFFDSDAVKRTIWLLRGKDPVTSHSNTIMDYTFYWFLSIYHYYMYTGDLDYLREQQSYMNALFDMAAGMVDGQGREHMTGAGRFLDWPTSRDRKAVDAGLHALLLMTFDAGIRMAGALGDTALAAKCSSAAERMMRISSSQKPAPRRRRSSPAIKKPSLDFSRISTRF